MGTRYTVTAGPGDLGARVVLRHRDPDGGLRDVVGHVQSWRDGVVRVRTRRGLVVEVREADLVAAKRVPEPAARRWAVADTADGQRCTTDGQAVQPFQAGR